MKSKILIAAGALALAIAPAAMAKDNGHGHGNGNGKGHGDHAAVYAPTYGQGAFVNSNGVWTNPAGRAHPHGMPPGQAKKIARARGDLVVGNVLPSSYPGYQTFNTYRTYNLPVAPAGYGYVRVGNDVYLRQTQSGVIANIISSLFR